MLQKVRDVLLVVASLMAILLMAVSLNTSVVARWKIEVDKHYWDLYEQDCVEVPNSCMGD